MDQQQQQNMNKDSDEYGQCGSPKAKKIFINMLDQMQNSPKSKSQHQKMKNCEEKSMNLSSPSSYHSSSPSSTSSLSSTPNLHHQKQPITHGTMNGSSEYISQCLSCLKLEIFNSKNPWNSRSERAHEPPKLLASPANAVWHFTTATSINATGHERRHESEFTANDWWGFIGLGLAAVTSIATIDIDEWSACARNSRSSGSHTNATGWAPILLYILKIIKFKFSRNYITNNSHNSCVTAASNEP